MGHIEHLFGLHITVQVMAVADVSPGNQYAVRTHLKCLQDEIRVDTARTHYPDNTHIGWILKTADSCKVGSRICTPATCKCHYLWAKISRHEI
jgi:hypothetical protein